jgi:hypothetical protein
MIIPPHQDGHRLFFLVGGDKIIEKMIQRPSIFVDRPKSFN